MVCGAEGGMMVRNVVRHPAPVGSRRVAFTGYRPQKMPFGFDESDERCVDFKTRLYNTIETLIEQGYKHFLSGGALGMDMFAAEAVLELKHKYPDRHFPLLCSAASGRFLRRRDCRCEP